MSSYEIYFNSTIAAVGVIISFLFGVWSELLTALLIFIALDYLTGLVNAVKNGELSAAKSLHGIIKKVFLLILVIVAYQLDVIANTDVIKVAVIYFLLANEGLSILENVAKAGVPIPSIIKDALSVLKRR